MKFLSSCLPAGLFGGWRAHFWQLDPPANYWMKDHKEFTVSISCCHILAQFCAFLCLFVANLARPYQSFLKADSM